MARPEQFKFFTMSKRTTALIDDDALVLLEHQYTKDRVRRIPFDQISYVLHCQGPATARLFGLFFLTLPLALAGILTLASTGSNNPVARGFAGILLVLAAFTTTLFLITIVRGRYHLQITRAGVTVHLSGIMAEQRFNRLVAEITDRTRTIQAGLASAATAAANANIPLPPDAPPPPMPGPDKSSSVSSGPGVATMPEQSPLAEPNREPET